jgi:tRNA pseudouridine55 synthase
MDGFLVIDKPEGVTSHDVVNSVRRILKRKKVGHTGTLDPFATGVLPVALGEATKAIPFLDESTKEYLAIMHLGVVTDTQDHTGKILYENRWDHVSEEIIKETFSRCIGSIKQVPPMFSALKRSGVPLYKLAREGKTIHRESRDITIFSLEIENMSLPRITFRVRCSRGTYVRTLAHDLGESLGCGAHLSELRRISSGIFTVAESISLENLSLFQDKGQLSDKIISIHRSLPHLRDIVLAEEDAKKVRNGIIPELPDFLDIYSSEPRIGEKFSLSYRNRLIAVAENISFPWSEGNRNMRLLRVFNHQESPTSSRAVLIANTVSRPC